jgi:DNA-binding LacI/PurR family transcriptional regulator
MSTIKDIAKQAGVSIATVSRVLNNHQSVNETTRYAVLKAAQELDYPIENLRLRNVENRTVLVITRQDDHLTSTTGLSGMREFERNVWGGVHSVLEKHSIATRLQQSRLTVEEAGQYANDPNVSGLILLGGVINPDFVNYFIEREVPFVVAGSDLYPLRVNSVMADVTRGFREAVSYLIEQGKERIGFVNGPTATRTSTEKMDGLRLTLEGYGLPFDPNTVVVSDFSADEGYRQTSMLLQQMPHLDAILYAEDTIAMGGLRALKERGYSVPGDLAVVGFGDYDFARYTDPPLTTVQFDMRLMGRIAARRLNMLLDEPDDETWMVRVPTTLIVRDSA